MKLLSLIGEQPIPVLLPALYLQPDRNVLVHTKKTQDVAKRLKFLLPDCFLLQVPAYAFNAIRDKIDQSLDLQEYWTFNLTGGTKLMAVGAFSLAMTHQIEFLYLKSEGHQNVLTLYRYVEGHHEEHMARVVPPLLTLSQYLYAHLPGFTEEGPHRNEEVALSEGGKFEEAIAHVLSQQFDEVMVGVKPDGVADQIDIDLLVRKGNQVGIIEAKTSGSYHPKRGIDQLTTAGSKDYLGAYTHRFYVLGSIPDNRIQVLARENNIQIIPLPGYSHGKVVGNDRKRLIARIEDKMSPE